MSSSHPRRLHLFAHMRTGSNLFTRLFNHHPDVKQKLYSFMIPTVFGPDRLPYEMGLTIHLPELREYMVPLYTKASIKATKAEVMRFIEDAESEGKSTLIKDHVGMLMEYPTKEEPTDNSDAHLPDAKSRPKSNPTFYSDEFLETLVPVFIIRHPARMTPSLYRIMNKASKITIADPVWHYAPKWTAIRLLFEWYKALYKTRVKRGEMVANGGRPIVIDGDDLINDTKWTMEQICDIAGVDEAGLQYSWEIEQNPYYEWPEAFAVVAKPWFGTLDQSTGIIRSPELRREPIIEDEAKAWQCEFGEEVADAITAACKEAMPDYLHLKQFCLKRGHT